MAGGSASARCSRGRAASRSWPSGRAPQRRRAGGGRPLSVLAPVVDARRTPGCCGRRCSGRTAATRSGCTTRRCGPLAALERRPAALRRAAALLTRGPRRPVEAFGLTLPGRGRSRRRDGQGRGRAARLGGARLRPRRAGHGHRDGAAGQPAAAAVPAAGEPGGLVNRMGFNNAGAAALAARLEAAGVRRGDAAPRASRVGVSLGKTKTTPLAEAAEDYLASFAAVAPHADYVAVNVSSPNTPGLRTLQEAGALRDLVAALVAAARDRGPGPPGAGPGQGRARPVRSTRSRRCWTSARRAGAAGLVATNTTLAPRRARRRRPRGGPGEAGGLSGAPLTARAREVVGLPRGPHRAAGDRGRRHAHRGRRPRRCSTPARGCCRSTPASSTAGPALRPRDRRRPRPREDRRMREPYGVRLAAARRRARPAVRRASTRTPGCCAPGASTPTSPAWNAAPAAWSRRSAARSRCSSRSRRSSRRTARAGVAVLERMLADIAGGRRAVAARRQARRHRLDHGRVRRRLPDRRLAAGRGRGHASARTSGFGSLDGAIERRAGARPRRLRAGPDQQPRGPAGAARDGPRTAGRVGQTDRRRGGPAQRRARGPATSGSWSARPSARTGTRFDAPERLDPRARAGRAGRHGRRAWPRSSARRCRSCCPRTSREVMGAGPDPERAARGRAAAVRGAR